MTAEADAGDFWRALDVVTSPALVAAQDALTEAHNAVVAALAAEGLPVERGHAYAIYVGLGPAFKNDEWLARPENQAVMRAVEAALTLPDAP